ncbi:MAG TPA: conjugal transfer protein TraC, partial [Candidatus Andersenbacteria bacterium]|nr:conjugal transfer protein TraC [Candidatus Andersenbacteria bacterium]
MKLPSFLSSAPKKTNAQPISKEDKAVMDQFEKGISSLRDLIAPSGFKVKTKSIEIDGKFATTIYVTTYPRYLDTNWFASIVNFDVEFDVAMFIYPQDSATILKELRKRITQVSTSITMQQEQGKVRDPQLETAYQDIEELRDRLVQGTERFYQYGLYITVYAGTEEELDDILSQIEVLLEGRLIYAKPALFQMEQAFTSTLPMGHDNLAVNTNMNTSPLSTSFP